MADDELMPFDPSMKKKKKKKKTPFDLDGASEKPEAADGAPTEGTTSEDTPSKSTEGEAVSKPKDEEPEQTQEKADDDFSLDFGGLKKKKKKKKAFEFDEMKEAVPETTPAPEEEPAQDGGTPAEVPTMGDDASLGLDLTLSKKKKKRKKNVEFDEAGGEEEKTGADTTGSAEIEERLGGGAGTEGKAWFGSDRDYSYDELLTRVFDIMKEKNPDMVAGEKKKIVMRPPQVLRVGAKKSSFANFADICRMLHRQPKHVLAFLLAELGTSGSVDGNNQLIIKGRFNQKQIENVLRRYIKEYVTCHTCKSPDTSLQKEERLFFLQCETCGSRCSVQSIKSGFQAVTGRRAALRASNA